MGFTHDTTLNLIQIILKSSQGKQNNGSKKSSISFELNENIVIPNNVDCYILLKSFKFINSFYNINSTNNVFYYSIDSVIGMGIIDIHNFEIPIGNYNITSFLAYLNVQLAGVMVITASNQTFKLTCTSSDIIILRNGVNSCLKVLGFNFVDTVQAYEITSPNLFNLSGVQMLYICISNFNVSSISSINSYLNNVIQDINIETLAGTTQSFNNTSASRYKIMNSLINKIDLNIYDENNQLVDFNNTDFFINVSLIFSYKMQYKQEMSLNLKGPQQDNIDTTL
jgi:hypothetical protein